MIEKKKIDKGLAQFKRFVKHDHCSGVITNYQYYHSSCH